MANDKSQAIPIDDSPTAPPPGMKVATDPAVAAAVAAAGSTPGIDGNALVILGKIIGDAMAAGMAQNAPPRRVSIGEYIRKGAHSPFHPNKTHPHLTRECWQNGSRLFEDNLFDREIELLNRITHSGRYIDRKVEVVVDDTNADEVVYVRFANKREAALELKGLAKNFIDMLEQIVAAQEVEDREASARNDQKVKESGATENRRHFGESKTTREARERAEAR